MNIDQTIHIDGLDTFQDHDLSMGNDTPPDAIMVKFEVVSEYMPFLSEQKGERVYKNFVHRSYIKELGHSTGSRRIKDTVEYDEASGRWKVKKLANKGQSDIKKFPNEWNAFYNGTTGNLVGTAIEFLFKHDPTRAELYKRNHVYSIEQLAGLSESDCQRGGMGWLDDKKRAQNYIARSKEAVTGVQFNAHVKNMEAENASLKSQVEELTSQVRQLLQSQLDEANKIPAVKRSKKVQPQPEV